MNIQFKGTNYEPSPEIVSMATKKLETLTKYLGKDSDSALAYVMLGKITEAHAKGDIWQAEINLTADGKSYNAKAVRADLRPAINAVAAELFREVRHNRTKTLTMKRQGGMKIKDFFRFGRS